jgi:hypothetical protein
VRIDSSGNVLGPCDRPGSLRHLLSLVHVDLAPDDKAKLEGMTVRQFLSELNRFCDQLTGALKDITVPEERVRETAAGFTMHGRKRGEADTAPSPPTA